MDNVGNAENNKTEEHGSAVLSTMDGMGEWRMVAQVLDRLLFLAVLIINIVCAIAFLSH